MTQVICETKVPVEGRAARVFLGGAGEPLLLIHGGWGGAATHWASVWATLAERFRVVAPDLPGIGSTDEKGLGSLGAYAHWLRALLDAVDVRRAWCVGNSFGASVACRFASEFPERCSGLVLVNGFPMPSSPPILQWLGERRLGQWLVRAIEKRVAYTPSALRRAFFDTTHIPPELLTLVSRPSPPQVPALADVLVHGGSPAPSGFAPLLLWGEDDHLPGTSARAAKKLQARWPGSTIAFVERAGHLPQVENPSVFVDALASFVGEGAREPRHAAGG